MNYLLQMIESAIAALQVWSPLQLLTVAAITILLGYVGLMSRLATR